MASSLRDDEFASVLKIVEQNFYAGKYVNEGELCHVCGTLLFLSKTNTVDWPYQETLRKIQNQVEKQLKNGSIESLERRSRRNDTYSGLQYHGTGAPDFQKILDMIENYKRDKAANEIIVTAPQILDWMKNELSRLPEELMHYGVGSSPFKSQPAFCFFKVEDFIDAFVEFVNYCFCFMFNADNDVEFGRS